jgi:hypothetical protein
METRHKRKAQAAQESKPDSKRSKRARKEQPDQAHPTSAKPAAGARLTRAASKATGEGPLAAQAEPERLLKHNHKRSSPKAKEEAHSMEPRGAGGHPGVRSQNAACHGPDLGGLSVSPSSPFSPLLQDSPDEDEFGRNAR